MVFIQILNVSQKRNDSRSTLYHIKSLQEIILLHLHIEVFIYFGNWEVVKLEVLY